MKKEIIARIIGLILLGSGAYLIVEWQVIYVVGHHRQHIDHEERIEALESGKQ